MSSLHLLAELLSCKVRICTSCCSTSGRCHVKTKIEDRGCAWPIVCFQLACQKRTIKRYLTEYLGNVNRAFGLFG